MIVERLFIEKSAAAQVQVEQARDFSPVEENAIYYAAGYVIQKLLQKHMQKSDDKSMAFVGILLTMVEKDIVGDMSKDTSTYLNYVKTWTCINDRGGLRHVSNDTYRLFMAIETRLYQLIKEGELKEKAIIEILMDPNVKFLWEIAANLPDEKQSMELLRAVVELWFVIRGFSITSQLLEHYKKATKSTIKGKKGLRKELH